MANLSVTTACNRACSYCFARDVFPFLPVPTPGRAREPPRTHISRRDFLRALDFLERSGIDQARLLGGEPTLHPEFPWLVDRVLERGLRLLVFSNGLMPEVALRRLEQAPEDRTAILLNVHPPTDDPPHEWVQQTATFRQLGPRVILGLNIHTPAAPLDFLLDLIREFQLSPCLRLGLAHPGPDGTNRFLHPRYYPEVGRRVAAFARRARQAGVELEFDCGFVPCMFPPGSLDTWGPPADDLGRRCNPIPDVLPDGQVIPCYPLARLGRMPLPDDHDAAYLQARFAERTRPYRSLGIFRECADCPLREAGDCVGGCLAAAMQRLRHSPFTVRVTEGKEGEGRGGQGSKGAREQGSKGEGEQEEPPLTTHHSPLTLDTSGTSNLWVIPYVDQPLNFWEGLYSDFSEHVREVYFPLPGDLIGSGRPPQPAEHLDEFLRHSPFPRSVLVNPLTLPRPVEEMAPAILEALRRLDGEFGLVGATVSNLLLAARLREGLPDLPLTASVLMDIAQPHQAIMLDGVCETLVPASRVMRDRPALEALRAAFPGRIRLIVNEACLPGCPFRVQHFHEMGSGFPYPRSLCDELLQQHPWLRLTGAWVLPQHLHLYGGLYDELKLAGRVTLQDPGRYRQVLEAYVHRFPLFPNEIGGGPASVLEYLDIEEEFFAHTLRCGRRCHECHRCRDYYDGAVDRGRPGAEVFPTDGRAVSHPTLKGEER